MMVLFVVKRNSQYGPLGPYVGTSVYARRSAGLWNSTSFVVKGLRSKGIMAKLVEVVDNNCIDRVVTEFRPDHVVIEALWVVPEKFDVLKRLHPQVEWSVHLHSNIPFLALEGVAINWITGYADRDVGILTNSRDCYNALTVVVGDWPKLVWLPNVYWSHFHQPKEREKPYLDIGCLGAIRPMKNQLLQAMAAVQFADDLGLGLRFWVNATRIETGGEPVLKNLRALFSGCARGELLELPWLDPRMAKNIIRTFDIGMQVSMSETFNVVTADYVAMGLPVVVSKEVPWTSRLCRADADSIKSMTDRLHYVWGKNWLVQWNQHLLKKASRQALDLWVDYLSP